MKGLNFSLISIMPQPRGFFIEINAGRQPYLQCQRLAPDNRQILVEQSMLIDLTLCRIHSASGTCVTVAAPKRLPIGGLLLRAVPRQATNTPFRERLFKLLAPRCASASGFSVQ